MANLFDYLEWRGDLSLKQAPFNDIDNLILSRISFLPWDGIISSSLKEIVTLWEASQLFFRSEEAIQNIIMKDDLRLLSDAAMSDRFGNMNLLGYVNQVDPEVEKQFSAIVIEVEPLLFYVSYMGTDFSFAGWKEDFNMSFICPVPAQVEAAHYLDHVAQNLKGSFLVGGHSKGGNLAVYGAAFCSPQTQERIITVYNNDGPGFDDKVLESPGYRRISGLVKTFVPQTSVIGILLQHEEEYIVVQSNEFGLMQHDIYSWEVDRDQLIYLEEVSNSSKFIDKTMKTWVANMEPEQRELFVDSLFEVLEQTHVTSVKELIYTSWLRNARAILKSLRGLDDEMRQNISDTLGLLVKSARENLSIDLPHARLISKGEPTQE